LSTVTSGSTAKASVTFVREDVFPGRRHFPSAMPNPSPHAGSFSMFGGDPLRSPQFVRRFEFRKPRPKRIFGVERKAPSVVPVKSGRRQCCRPAAAHAPGGYQSKSRDDRAATHGAAVNGHENVSCDLPSRQRGRFPAAISSHSSKSGVALPARASSNLQPVGWS